MRRFGLAAAIILPVLFTASGAAPAPHITLAKMADLPMVEMKPYDEAANADADVTAALAKAKKEGKLVLIELGGNWCPDCRVLANVLRLAEMQSFLAKNYVIVSVDVGRFNKNLTLPNRFGVDGKLQAVPAVLVIGTDGKLLNKDDLFALGDARTMTPQAIADWLAKWTK